MLKRYPKPYMSYSQISSYLSCEANFYNTYILGNRDDGNKWTEIGNFIHDMAENFPSPTIEDLPAINKAMNEKLSRMDRSKFEDHVEYQEYVQKGREMLQNFVRRYKDQPKPVAVEKKFDVRIINGLPPALSYIDRIDGDPDDPSTWVVTDYKSTNTPWPKSRLKDEFQLMWYATQLHRATGHWPARLQYYFPVADKFVSADLVEPGVYRFNNQREPVLYYREDEMLALVHQVYDNIMAGKFDSDSNDSFFCRNFCSVHKGLTEEERTKATGWDAI